MWKANAKSWMTRAIFLEYLQQFNNRMQFENQKRLVLLDDAPCHPEMELSNVKLVFLPPNTTAGTQSLDNGIIRNFKIKYREMLHEFLLSHENLAALDDVLKRINVGHARRSIDLSKLDWSHRHYHPKRLPPGWSEWSGSWDRARWGVGSRRRGNYDSICPRNWSRSSRDCDGGHPTHKTVEDGWEETVLFPPRLNHNSTRMSQKSSCKSHESINLWRFERTWDAYGLCYN